MDAVSACPGSHLMMRDRLVLLLLLLQAANTPTAFLQPLLPKSGLVVSEKGGLSELLCKPKILPLKSATLKRLEALQVGALLCRYS